MRLLPIILLAMVIATAAKRGSKKSNPSAAGPEISKAEQPDESYGVFESTVCECDNSDFTELIRFDEQSCEQRTPKTEIVHYEVYKEVPSYEIIPAVACTRWIKTRGGSNSFKHSKGAAWATIVRDTSPSECWDMVRRKVCGGKAMVPTDGSTWVYEEDPEGGGMWPQTKRYEVLNCKFENIQLYQECENCVIKSPIGDIEPNKTLKIARHVTICNGSTPWLDLVPVVRNRRRHTGTRFSIQELIFRAF